MALTLEMIIDVLDDATGPMTARQIVTQLRKEYPSAELGNTPNQTVRARLQEHSSDSTQYKGRRDLFHRTTSVQSRKGLWVLRRNTHPKDDGLAPDPSVTHHRNPLWIRDELIVTLALYMEQRANLPGPNDPAVIALSNFLNLLATNTRVLGDDRFRNPNGVAMKLQNFRRFDPTQTSSGLAAGGRLEESIWLEFSNDLARLQSEAADIKSSLEIAATSNLKTISLDRDAEEGGIRYLVHKTYERNKALIQDRKSQALKAEGALRCEACYFDFSARYGDRGEGFIECHHTKPISEMGPGSKTKLEDLALLCANCHRMIHVRKPWLRLDELRALLTIAPHPDTPRTQ